MELVPVSNIHGLITTLRFTKVLSYDIRECHLLVYTETPDGHMIVYMTNVTEPIQESLREEIESLIKE